MAAWVDMNVKPDENILIFLQNANVLHILTAGNRTFSDINTCIGEISFVPARRCSPPYITFWINKGTENPDNPRDLISGISEPGFISAVRENNVKYVIVTPRLYYLYYYLKIHPDFEEVIRLGNSVVFQVIHPVQPISSFPNVKWETCVGMGTPEYLKNLQEIYPARYEAMLRDQFGPWMGLTRQDLTVFENWQGCEFDSVYGGKSYTLH
jgi:hypothetical protein